MGVAGCRGRRTDHRDDRSLSLQSPMELPGGSWGYQPTGLAPCMGVGRGRRQTQARVRPETLGPGWADQPSDEDAPTVLLAPPLCASHLWGVRKVPRKEPATEFWYRVGSRLVSSLPVSGGREAAGPLRQEQGPYQWCWSQWGALWPPQPWVALTRLKP